MAAARKTPSGPVFDPDLDTGSIHGPKASPKGMGAAGAEEPREELAGDSWPELSGLAPIIAPGARLIVLGSFPGEASLRAQQYYGHPRNHFWPILSEIWGVDLKGAPYAERVRAAHGHGLGLWDVYASCRREGSLDSAIQGAELNDLAGLLARAPELRAIAHNGGESAKSMKLTAALGLPVVRLPSTSPANASWSFERKLAAWRSAFQEYGVA